MGALGRLSRKRPLIACAALAILGKGEAGSAARSSPLPSWAEEEKKSEEHSLLPRAGRELALTDAASEKEQAATGDQAPSFDRIVTPEEVAAAARPAVARPFLVLGWPLRKLGVGMERGLVAFEKHKMREKLRDWQERLAAKGFGFLFGGLGEATGFGAGTAYEFPARQKTALRLLGRLSFSGYQEFNASLDSLAIGRSSLVFQANYQWRPFERFFGLGQHSLESQASHFALRQLSFGPLWQLRLHRRLRLGAEYRVARLGAFGAQGGLFPSTLQVFGEGLSGLEETTRLQSLGLFVDADGLRGEYALGGRAYLEGSWQDGLGQDRLRYGRYEARLEGKLPVAPRRSALVGQAVVELTRESSGSSLLPFYLYPRIGGSATLRGFPLDRFYGRNIIFLTLEYRFAIHPNVETQIIFDEGQVFDHTRSLSFLDWHRNYGFGFRFHSSRGTVFRIEGVHGSEGFIVHISFGDRLPRPLGGPVRYPLYRP